MSFTKVAPAGIGTEPGTTLRLGDSLLHSTGLDIGVGSGIGVTIRQHGDATFTGIITASAFFGDGSGLEGVSSSGIGTPLSDDDTSTLNKAYYVNQELSIGSTVTVNHPSSAVASYTHYQDIVVKDDADFIVADGDTFIPDVLGINTSTLPNAVSSATGGRIRAGTITNAGANGAVNFPNGLVGTSATFTGVLTYEDVTNVDSIGIITARGGIRIGGGTTVGPSSGIVTYFGDGSQLTGISGVTINNNANNRIITGSGTANTLEGEANLTFNGTNLLSLHVPSATGEPAINFTNSDTGTGSSNGFGIGINDAESPYIYNRENTDIRIGVNNTERVRITKEGYVTKSAHPCFDVVRSAGHVSSGNYIIYNTVNVNNGSHYNASNGKFTAPVAGHYFFAFGTIKNTGAVTRLYFRKNGSNFPTGADRHLRMDSGQGGYGDNGAHTIIVSLAVSDEIQIYVGQGEVHSSTQEYCYFNGFLLG